MRLKCLVWKLVNLIKSKLHKYILTILLWLINTKKISTPSITCPSLFVQESSFHSHSLVLSCQHLTKFSLHSSNMQTKPLTSFISSANKLKPLALSLLHFTWETTTTIIQALCFVNHHLLENYKFFSPLHHTTLACIESAKKLWFLTSLTQSRAPHSKQNNKHHNSHKHYTNKLACKGDQT
jgi:hypothetical protein